MILKSWIFNPNRPPYGRSACVAVGIVVAGTAYYLGFAQAEPTMMAGMAFAALGAVAGILVFGIYDVIRKSR